MNAYCKNDKYNKYLGDDDVCKIALHFGHNLDHSFMHLSVYYLTHSVADEGLACAIVVVGGVTT